MSYEQLWAPWRLAYIKQPVPDEPCIAPALDFLPGADRKCFLCQAAVDPANLERHVVHMDQNTVTVLNRFPYNNGHLLVAPKRHCARLDALMPQEHAAVAEAVTQMVVLLEKVLRSEGFNIGLNLGSVAGAGLPGHLHWHIVPRWSGDTNFMLTSASVKVIPQALGELHQTLIGALR